MGIVRAIALPFALAWAGALPAQPLAYETLELSPSDPAPAPQRVRDIAIDRLEWRARSGADGYGWDAAALVGGPVHRLWIASAGDATRGRGLDYLEMQAFYSHAVSESWELQAGLRYDIRPRPQRAYLALGAQGYSRDLSVGAFAFLSNESEFTARLFGQYDLKLLPRLVLQPSLETEIAGRDVPELGIGAGPVFVEGRLRLLYELRGPFAPYLGVSWERLLGRTARMAREENATTETAALLLGLRSAF